MSPASSTTTVIAYDSERYKDIIYTMATCHSLRVVDDELLGDPLDVKMFQFTGWSYEEGGNHVSEHSNLNFDTIMPSIARPPAPGLHVTNPDLDNSNVGCFVSRKSILGS